MKGYEIVMQSTGIGNFNVRTNRHLSPAKYLKGFREHFYSILLYFYALLSFNGKTEPAEQLRKWGG